MIVKEGFLSNQTVLCYCSIGKASKFNKLQNQVCQLKEDMASVLRDNPEDNPILNFFSSSEQYTPQSRETNSISRTFKTNKNIVKSTFMLEES